MANKFLNKCTILLNKLRSSDGQKLVREDDEGVFDVGVNPGNLHGNTVLRDLIQVLVNYGVHDHTDSFALGVYEECCSAYDNEWSVNDNPPNGISLPMESTDDEESFVNTNDESSGLILDEDQAVSLASAYNRHCAVRGGKTNYGALQDDPELAKVIFDEVKIKLGNSYTLPERKQDERYKPQGFTGPQSRYSGYNNNNNKK